MVVTVLMATFNGARFLEEQINSILQQKNVSLRLVIRDDGSTDDTLTICQQFACKDSRVRVYQRTEGAAGAAENFCRLIVELPFRCGSGEWVALADQDDIWYPHKLSRALREAQDRDVSGYSSNVEALYSNGSRKLIRKDTPQKPYDYLFEGPGPGSTYLLREDLFIDLQAFLRDRPDLSSKVRFHDWLIYAFARSRGFAWHIDAKPGLAYRQHEMNVIGANLGLKSAILRAKYVLLEDGFDEALSLRRALFPGSQCAPYPVVLNRVDLLRLAFKAHLYRRTRRGVLLFALSMILKTILPAGVKA